MGQDLFSICQQHGIECTISMFAIDTKLCGALRTLEGRNDIQRDLERLERCACAISMELNKAKCKILHLGQGIPVHKYMLGRKQIESSLSKKAQNIHHCALAAQKTHPRLHQMK